MEIDVGYVQTEDRYAGDGIVTGSRMQGREFLLGRLGKRSTS
jgi:hypothetical protein